MTQQTVLEGVYFIYDGDCPICKMAAEATRIKAALGPLTLIDARDKNVHPLIGEVNERRLNLDDSMVIYHQGDFHHGNRALQFMATYGGKKGFFNRFNRLMFRSPMLSRLLYPLMRGTRNGLLFIRGKDQIHNLRAINDPIFKPVFGDSWDTLPTVMHKHYANRPNTSETNTAEGLMCVETAPVLKVVAPLLKLLGGIPAVNAKDVPVTVEFESEPAGPALHFNRSFHFPGEKPYIFHSRMVPQGGSEIVEQMKFGLGWRVSFSWNGERVVLLHQGYAICILGRSIPMPLNWLFGHVHAEEQVIDDTRFKMFVEIRHWLFGKIYEYRGEFEMVK
ncbi:MAG: DUF4166 domain-containing protein [Kordiimonas sp.]